MPSTADTQLQARIWACNNLRQKIDRFVIRHHLSDLLRPRILDPLGISNLETAELQQLQTIHTLLQPLTLYR
jgi:hypothetical protein